MDGKQHRDKFDPDDWSLDEPSRSWRSVLAAAPAVGAGFVPVGVCPVCMAATAGIFSALGLGFLLETRFLAPLMAAFLGVALWALAHKAELRRGFGPLLLGVISAAAIFTGKFALSSDTVLNVGLTGLGFAAVWNARPVKQSRNNPCPACQTTE